MLHNLFCKAVGKPLPHYMWYDLGGNAYGIFDGYVYKEKCTRSIKLKLKIGKMIHKRIFKKL